MPRKGKAKKSIKIPLKDVKRLSLKGKSTRKRNNPVVTVTKFSNSRPVRGSQSTFRFGHAEGGKHLVISGSEVFTQAQCKQVYTATGFALSPSNALLFPKLVALNTIFKEFRFLNLRFRYIPACPTIRTGSISMFIDTDPTDADPASVREIMNNSMSVTGPVGQPIELVFDPSTQRLKWYYTGRELNIATGGSSFNGNFVDERQHCPGKFVVSGGDADSADDGALAGYVEVIYSVEFKTMTPANDLFADFEDFITPDAGSFSYLTAFLINCLGLDGYISGSTRVPPGITTIPEKSLVLLKAGSYVLRALIRLAGIASDSVDKRPSFPHLKSHRLLTDVLKEDSDEKKSLDTEYFDVPSNGSRVVSSVEKKLPDSKSRIVKESVTYLEYRQDDQGRVWGLLPDGTWVLIPPLDTLVVPPMTSGDYTVNLNTYPPQGSPTSIVSLTGNSSGATTVSKEAVISLSVPTYLYTSAIFADARGGSHLTWGYSRLNDHTSGYVF